MEHKLLETQNIWKVRLSIFVLIGVGFVGCAGRREIKVTTTLENCYEIPVPTEGKCPPHSRLFPAQDDLPAVCAGPERCIDYLPKLVPSEESPACVNAGETDHCGTPACLTVIEPYKVQCLKKWQERANPQSTQPIVIQNNAWPTSCDSACITEIEPYRTQCLKEWHERNAAPSTADANVPNPHFDHLIKEKKVYFIRCKDGEGSELTPFGHWLAKAKVTWIFWGPFGCREELW